MSPTRNLKKSNISRTPATRSFPAGVESPGVIDWTNPTYDPTAGFTTNLPSYPFTEAPSGTEDIDYIPGALNPEDDNIAISAAELIASYNSLVASLIIDSGTYQQARRIFISDDKYGKSFLSRLIVIPDSYRVPDETVWDEIGFTNNYDTALSNAFNDATAEIRKLVSEYYDFISKLPVSELQQLSDAGINAAVTGEGITPAETDSASNVESPSDINPFHAAEFISNGVSNFLSFINNIGSLYSNFSSVALNRQSVSKQIEQISSAISLAEQNQWNAQELHDYMMTTLGYTSSSPHRKLDTSPGTVGSDNISTAENEAVTSSNNSFIERLVSDNDVSMLSQEHGPIQYYNTDGSPDGEPVVISGLDVLRDMSRFKFLDLHAQQYKSFITNSIQAGHSALLAQLEANAAQRTSESQIQQGIFNSDFYSSRNGRVEGVLTTSKAKLINDQISLQMELNRIEKSIQSMRLNQLRSWMRQVNTNPSVAPFLYKGLFDFDMTDTFTFSDPSRPQSLFDAELFKAYGQTIGSAIGDFMGNKSRGGQTVKVK